MSLTRFRKLKLSKLLKRGALVLVWAALFSLFVNELDKYVPAKSFVTDKLLPEVIVEIVTKSLPPDSSIKILQNERYGHTCSAEASEKGYHQKIISYSFRNNPNIPGYWTGLNHTLGTIKSLYPGWNVRIYARSGDIRLLKTKISNHDHLFYCDVENVPPPLHTVYHSPATVWRYAPMSDPQADIIIFRDSDSQILQREVDAVNVWLHKTNKTLHVMRDNKHHNVAILGGMWGLRIHQDNRMRIRDMLHTMLKGVYNYARNSADQPIIKKVVWAALKDDSIAHDSYTCNSYPGSIPFPTKRNDERHFVGSAYYKANHTKVCCPCPVSCRPKNHLDWIYC